MTKSKVLTFIISMFILLPTIHASCTEEEINHFKEIENEYKVTYEYNETTETYTLTFHEAEPEKYIYYFEYGEENNLCDIENETYICRNIKPNNYDLEIFGITSTCNNNLKTTNLYLKYNSYSKSELCNGIEEFILCQPTYDKEISYEEFVSRVETYKKTRNEETKKSDDNQDKNENKINTYIEDNLVQIIIISVFIIMVIITIILTAKSIRKSRRLE